MAGAARVSLACALSDVVPSASPKSEVVDERVTGRLCQRPVRSHGVAPDIRRSES
jgi:hypothetical protein